MSSIRQRLLILLLGLWMTVWLSVALITLDRSGHEVGELLDAQLAQTAHVLRHITLAGNLPDLAAEPQALSPFGHPYENKISFQLWRGGELVSTFGGAPGGPLADAPGFSNQDIGSIRWRVFGLPTGRPGETLFVAQSYTIRQELIQFLTIHALEPILWSLPLTALLMWFAVSDGLRPLRRLAAVIGKLSAERLRPIDEQTVPVEARPLTNALNGLMERLEYALSVERRFAADASHELRTPLAVIRTHAQIARRSKNDAERAEALDRLIQGVDRATQLAAELLTLARMEPDVGELERGAWSLSDVVRRVAEDKRATAQAKSVDLTTSIRDGDPCVVPVGPSVLEILVANLLDNAIKYTPDGGQVRVGVHNSGQRTVLRVEDSGPGIPPEDRERVLERFYRRNGHAEPGTGLGLSLVRRICQLHGAEIKLLDVERGSGLRVEVAFGSLLSSLH